MATSLFAFSALFTAVMLMMTGIGLLGTTLSLRLTLEHIPAPVIGMTMAAYFVGMVTGGLVCHRLVERVGHIRSFAVFAAISTAAVLLHGLFFSVPAWAAFRFLTGISNIGLYTVIESWLCECTEPRFRGRVLSVYMLLAYLGIALGQQLLTLGSVSDHKLFFIVGVSSALLIVNGIGAGIGPIAASSLMALIQSPSGFFGYSMTVGGLFAFVVFLLRRSEKVAIVPVAKQVDFIPMKSTSHMAMQIDPRTEDEIYDRFN